MKAEWLALSYRVPSEPSRNRVHLWRKLKDMGAVYLQQAVAILPHSEAFLNDLQALRRECFEMEGEAAVAVVSFVNHEDEERLVRECRASRDEEYEEVVEQAERLIYELERETAKDKFTFAEVEENEEELAKIRRWLAKITTRDYFGAEGRGAAEKKVEEAAGRLQAYSEEVYTRDAPPQTLMTANEPGGGKK
ncbi:MAG: Chromate resistance protein ChrB [Bacillota bacterium]